MLGTVNSLSLALSMIPVVVYLIGLSISWKNEDIEPILISHLIDCTFICTCLSFFILGKVALQEAIISGMLMVFLFQGKEEGKYNAFEKFQVIYDTIFSYFFIIFFVVVLKSM